MWNRFLTLTRLASVAAVSVALCASLTACTGSDDSDASDDSSTDTMAASDPSPSSSHRANNDHPNLLSDAEVDAGWTLLFDGTSFEHWRGYRSDSMPGGWTVDGEKNGATMHFAGNSGEVLSDIITKEQYGDFELRLQWKISPGGNSGLMYHVTEDAEYPWQTGPEMQILDDDRHPDAEDPTHRAGALYDMIAPDTTVKQLAPVGEWNDVHLIVNDGRAEHWLNGAKVVEYPTEGPEWTTMVAESKFGDMPQFGVSKTGHLCLQDHDDPVWFRNVKIRRLE